MAYPSKDRSSQKSSGGKKYGDGYATGKACGGSHVPGGQKWSAGGNVTESRLNKGGDKAWRGSRGSKTKKAMHY